MQKPIIEIENISKRYSIGAHKEPYLSLRDEIAKTARSISSAFSRVLFRGKNSAAGNETDFWALKDVSFSVQEGEAVGIIGRNGAGKSTLLKILSQITPPTEGKITMRGRVASLLEVGTGFHPELTGRENIFLNGTILGMTRREVTKKFDEIVAFAEVEKFLDTPVKRYSSGMYVRLAFAVAAHLEPEILVIDEVLAVGDAQFQKKCLGKMGEVAEQGRTVLFVSHNMGILQNLCKRAVLLEQGHLIAFGTSTQVVSKYIQTSHGSTKDLAIRTDRRGDGRIRITGLDILDSHHRRIATVYSGQDVCIALHYRTTGTVANVPIYVSLHVESGMGMRVFSSHNRMTGDSFGDLASEGVFLCNIRDLPLPSGRYHLSYTVMDHGSYLDGLNQAAILDVDPGDFHRTGYVTPDGLGCCLVRSRWSVERGLQLHKEQTL